MINLYRNSFEDINEKLNFASVLKEINNLNNIYYSNKTNIDSKESNDSE